MPRYPLLTETQILVCNYTKLLGSFSNLVELCGHGYFIQYLSVGIDSCHHTLVLHHLTVIELTQVDLVDTKQQSVVARLIIGAPNLHKLKITTCGVRKESDTPYVLFEDVGCEPNFRLVKLREVNLCGVFDYLFGMHLIKLLLKSSPVIELICIRLISPKAEAELLGFRRSSTNARIFMSNMMQLYGLHYYFVFEVSFYCCV